MAVAVAAIAIISLALPITSPFVAGIGAAVLIAPYRQRHSRVLLLALAVTVVVFVISIVIDFGLLASGVQSGVPVRVSP
jgi:predicted PurR-regulated permease PerM